MEINERKLTKEEVLERETAQDSEWENSAEYFYTQR